MDESWFLYENIHAQLFMHLYVHTHLKSINNRQYLKQQYLSKIYGHFTVTALHCLQVGQLMI